MELKFGSIASSLTLVAAWAYSLGWIKTTYFIDTFGIGLGSLELTPQDYLFASWYTIENVMFLLLLLWIVALSGRLWPWLFVAVYLPIPFLTEWSYGHLRFRICRYLVDNPHTILKFLPFVVLILMVSIHRESIPRFREASWPHGNFALAMLLIVTVAWSISAAMHIGGSDAKRALRDPDANLLRVTLQFPDGTKELKSIESENKLYMLYFSPNRCIVLDLAGYDMAAYELQKDQDPNKSLSNVRVLDIPRDKLLLVNGVRNVPGAGELLWHGF
jgi:hypothetical protein